MPRNDIAHGGDLFAICRERGWDWREVLDLSASINPFRPPVEAAICAALDRIAHYPEREPRRLIERLAEAWSVEPERILVGNGATELIHFLARELPVESVVVEIPAFGEFHRAWPEARCARFEDLPPDGFAIVSQPNNPTGEGHDLSGWDRAGLVDESFLDFTDRPSLVARTRERRDLLVLRSLTKFYALPGLRVGALVGPPDTIARLRERREPWAVNVLAEEAALAALSDPHWARWSKQMISIERDWLWEELRRLPGIRPVRGEANFFLLYVEGAARMCRWFLERKVILRDCTGWPGLEGEAVRLAVRRRDESCRFLDLLKEYLCKP
jgi:threonine-phosphate decarboxylase